MIENLPQEMRERFTEMREMDLQVANSMDSLEERVKQFFKKCSTKEIKPDWKDEQFSSLKSEYSKALEDADEKVQLANSIYDLVERYLRKLDQEVNKFKMELEADNAGITELLERRSLELDKQPPILNNHRAEKRKYSGTFTNHVEKRSASTDSLISNINNEVNHNTTSSRHITTTVPTSSYNNTNTSAVSYNLGHMGAASSNAAIAVAASRAIGATLEMQQGRRTSSFKASAEILARTGEMAKELTYPERNIGTPSISTHQTHEPKISRNKKSNSRSTHVQHVVVTPPPPVEEPPLLQDVVETTTVEGENSNSTWAYDPNEPRYCFCNDVSYGEMVGCDNNDCPSEWFHYPCVGLTQAPKGKWFCPQCTTTMKRRGRK